MVPCYNYGRFLPACIDSVLSQPDVDVRVLVIDDCSTDGSGEIADRLAADDARVRVVHHATNQGHIATYNEGLLGWADREYVVLLSADDLLAPGSLRRATSVMDADSSVGMVYGHAPYFERNADIRTSRDRAGRIDVWDGREWIARRCRSAVNVISSPEVVCRTAVQHTIGGYEPSLPHVGDLEMWLRVASVSNIAYVRGVPQAYYRVHPASMQRTSFAAHLDDLRQRREGFDYFFDHAGSGLPDVVALREQAHLTLAREALWRACRAYDRSALLEVPVQELIDFAAETSVHTVSTPEHRGLVRRQRLGPEFCRRTKVFVASGVRHRARTVYRHARWKRRGV